MYSLLTVLFYQNGSDQVTIASEVGIDRSNVADVLQRLSNLGLVQRRRSGTDRRSVIPSLTSKGIRITKQMNVAAVRAQKRLLAPLTPAFQPAFTAMLLQLIEGNNQYSRIALRADFAPIDRRNKGMSLTPKK
jgi:DNA-binding MarR family transcriptional regulator